MDEDATPTDWHHDTTEDGKHVITWGNRTTSHKTRLCRPEVCGREAKR